MSEISPAAPVETPSSEPLRPSFLDLFYQVMFYPVETFRAIASGPWADNRLLFYGLLSVILVSAIAPIIHIATTGGTLDELVIQIPLNVLVGVFIWAFMGLVMALLSYAFIGQTRIRTFLTLSALAPLPWLLMGPVMLLKIGLGDVGVFLAATLGLCIWLWTILLFALAVMCTYDMTAERVLIVLAAPVVLVLVLAGWAVGFVVNVAHLLPR